MTAEIGTRTASEPADPARAHPAPPDPARPHSARSRPSRSHPAVRRLRRVLPKPWARRWWLRRCLAVLLMLAASWLAVLPTRPGPPPKVRVVAAAHDLSPGQALTTADLVLTSVDPALVPAGALTGLRSVTGQSLAAPARRGELLTDARLAGGVVGGLPPGTSAVPVRLGDTGVAELLRPGNRVDVIASGGQDGGPGTVLAQDAVVLLVPPVSADDPGKSRLILVALPLESATRVAGNSLQRDLTVTLR